MDLDLPCNCENCKNYKGPIFSLKKPLENISTSSNSGGECPCHCHDQNKGGCGGKVEDGKRFRHLNCMSNCYHCQK